MLSQSIKHSTLRKPDNAESDDCGDNSEICPHEMIIHGWIALPWKVAGAPPHAGRAVLAERRRLKIRFSTIAPFAIMLRPDSSCRGDLPIGIALDPHVRSISRFVSARQLDLVYDRDSLQRRQTGGMKELAQPSLQSCSSCRREGSLPRFPAYPERRDA